MLNTGRVLEHWHTGTMTRRSKALDEISPTPFVDIHPEDAARLGIADGEPVRVESRRGAVIVPARVTNRVDPGNVFIPFHFREAAANLLTIDALDPTAKIPEYQGPARCGWRRRGTVVISEGDGGATNYPAVTTRSHGETELTASLGPALVRAKQAGIFSLPRVVGQNLDRGRPRGTVSARAPGVRSELGLVYAGRTSGHCLEERNQRVGAEHRTGRSQPRRLPTRAAGLRSTRCIFRRVLLGAGAAQCLGVTRPRGGQLEDAGKRGERMLGWLLLRFFLARR